MATALHHGVKAAYKRRRPPGALLHGKTEPSFPSGHATTVLATSAAAAYLGVRTGRIDAKRAAAGATAAAGMVGLSRAYLDKHWASDVLAGWLAGLAVAASTAWLLKAS